MAHNETIFYRIEKRDDAGSTVQNFYVPNVSGLDEVNLVDTQIIYGKTYTYHIFAVQLVVGNEYFYKRGPTSEDNSPSAPPGQFSNPYQMDQIIYDDGHMDKFRHLAINLVAETRQSVKLIEVPYVIPTKLKLQDSPPVPPDINFVPYRGIDNKVLITFNTGMGEYYDEYIPILKEDTDIIANSAIVNNKGQTLFKSEGDASGFDMFRISEIQMPGGPTSYSDFGITNTTKHISLKRDSGNPTFVDNIFPNTKYWYTFRSNDEKHDLGHSKKDAFFSTLSTPDFSNPTDVYEIQMINNNGGGGKVEVFGRIRVEFI